MTTDAKLELEACIDNIMYETSKAHLNGSLFDSLDELHEIKKNAQDEDKKYVSHQIVGMVETLMDREQHLREKVAELNATIRNIKEATDRILTW